MPHFHFPLNVRNNPFLISLRPLHSPIYIPLRFIAICSCKNQQLASTILLGQWTFWMHILPQRLQSIILHPSQWAQFLLAPCRTPGHHSPRRPPWPRWNASTFWWPLGQTGCWHWVWPVCSNIICAAVKARGNCNYPPSRLYSNNK